MPGGAEIGGVLCGLVFLVLLGTVVGAVILRAAIALYNALAGGATSASGATG